MKKNKSEKWKKQFTKILIGSKIIVFTTFLWVSMILLKLDRPLEAIALVIVAALYIALNKLDQLSGN